MKYPLAIFDFDGTLADSFPFFLGALEALAERHGFRKIDPAQIGALRQCGAREVLQRVGLPLRKLPAVARSFAAIMRSSAVPLFAEVPETLAQLARAGTALAIVTANSEENVRRILGPENGRLIGHYACRLPLFGKHASIRRVLAASALPARQAIYIGDQIEDAEAARKAGIAFGAVTWGYGARAALERHRPEEIFDSVRDLRRIA